MTEGDEDFSLGLIVSEGSVKLVSGHTQKNCPRSGLGDSHLNQPK